MITGAETAHLALKHSPIFLEGRLTIADEPAARTLGLRNGQVVQGTVEVRSGALALNLAGLSVPLPQDLPASLHFAAGDTALFRVQVQSNGSIVLQPLPVPGSGTAQAGPAPVLPHWPDRMEQLGLRPPYMDALGQLLRPGVFEGLMRSLSSHFPDLATLIQQWLRQRPSMAQLTPERLQQLFTRSGWMTESLLANGRGADPTDLKVVLRQLLNGLEGQEADGVHLLRSALDDIESRQLLAADSLASREWVFSIMLPFRDAEPVTLRFARSRRQEQQERAPYIIHLHTRNRDLGELWLQTCISDLTEVDMVMWALRQDVVERARQQAPDLAAELENAGLHMKRLQVVHGPGPQDTSHWSPPEHGSMVDVHT